MTAAPLHRPNFRPQVTPVTTQPAGSTIETWREKIVIGAFLVVGFAIVWGRYFYLQAMQGEYYELVAQRRAAGGSIETGVRGRIYDVEGNLLVSNRDVYQILANSSQTADAERLYDMIAPILATDREASGSLRPREEFLAKMNSVDGWVWLTGQNVSQESKEAIDALDWPCQEKSQGRCLQFDQFTRRYYPEGSLAAHVLGYYRHDNSGGSYGIEQGMDLELSGQTVTSTDSNDPISGRQIVSDLDLDGRDVYLTIDRDLQYLVETTLEEGVKRFGAMRGEIVITEPNTGRILAMAAYPTYEPEHYQEYDTAVYKNPSLVDYYEPGSTFKVITMSAAIDAGLVSPGTVCPKCSAPREIAGHVINNWNGVPNGPITMTQALEKSDNIALVWVSDLLGSKRFAEYIKKFGIGEVVETESNDKNEPWELTDWGPVETANRSFGQGLVVTSLQLVRAVGAIANGGNLMKMTFVDHVVDKTTGDTYYSEPEVVRTVISESTARTMQKMMQTAAQHGEAQYIFKNSDLIAGKTGTAQIPLTSGGYEDETIASFIGFAPYDDAKFVMLVKYERPHTSIYAAETAAVTWKELAEKLFWRFNIRADETTN